MNKNDPITITPCANGFIIEPRISYNQAVPDNEIIVFHGKDELMEFLCEYFDRPHMHIKQTEGK